jgi:hypothetical protein
MIERQVAEAKLAAQAKQIKAAQQQAAQAVQET